MISSNFSLNGKESSKKQKMATFSFNMKSDKMAVMTVSERLMATPGNQNQSFSFFDAPLPKYNQRIFKVDPAIIGRSLQRPSRPINQFSAKYGTMPLKCVAPGEREVASHCRQELFA